MIALESHIFLLHIKTLDKIKCPLPPDRDGQRGWGGRAVLHLAHHPHTQDQRGQPLLRDERQGLPQEEVRRHETDDNDDDDNDPQVRDRGDAGGCGGADRQLYPGKHCCEYVGIQGEIK